MANSIIKELIVYLRSISAITDITGNRIKPGTISQVDTNPFITLNTIYSNTDQTLAGTDDFVTKGIKINCVSNSYKDTDQLHEIVRQNLDTYQQSLIGPFWINSTRIVDEFDDMIEPKSNNQKWTYIKTSIYEIHYPQVDSNV